MGDTPDQLRAQIDLTRNELQRDVSALSDKVNPKRAVERRVGAVRGAVSGAKERLMGAAESTAGTTTGAMSGAAHAVGGAVDSMQQAPALATRQTQGAPIAAGFVAFGIGLLASQLLPATEKERTAACTLKDKAGDLKQPLTDIAGELKDNLAEPAQQAVEQVKESATQAVEQTKEQAGHAASDVKDTAATARENVTGEAADAARTVKDVTSAPDPYPTGAGTATTTPVEPPLGTTPNGGY